MDSANEKAEQLASEIEAKLSAGQSYLVDLRRLFSGKNKPAIVTLVLILAATVAAWLLLSHEVEKNREHLFEQKSMQVIKSIQDRLYEHEQILFGVAGLFDANTSVDRTTFRNYVARLQLEKNFPGILAVGYAKVLPSKQLPEHIAAIRAEGFPNFSVYPAQTKELFAAPVTYIEPFAGRNLVAFGYNLYSEPIRRKAMYGAAETGLTMITEKVKLVQENQGKVQAGFLMYVPIYRKGVTMTTPADRLRALQGFAYSPYRMNDLMAGIMGDNAADIDFKIYVDSQTNEAGLMFDSAEQAKASERGKYQQVKRISAYGVTWAIVLNSKSKFDVAYSSTLPLVVLLMGGSIALLLFFLMSSMLAQRDHAIFLALKMTQKIRFQSSKLSHSEERFELALRGANDGLWDRNIETGTVYYSPRWKIILGYSDDELPNQQQEWLKRIHPDDVEALLSKEKRYLDGAVERFQNEYRLLHKDGHYIWVVDRGLIQFGEDGKASRLIGVISDISEQKRIDKLKSEFISTVSHELRTPLTSIAASLGLLEAGVFGDLHAKALGLVAIANKNSKRLTVLVNDILDMEKLMSGKTVFRTDQIDMMEIVQQAIELNADYANSYSVQYKLCSPVGVYKVIGDRDRLMQVMANLMSNAAKFSPAGSVVEIRILAQKTMVRIEVEDHGPGIPDEFRHRIFSEFAQADSSDTRQQGGTGLGLNISQKLVARMDGEIGYETEVGKGSIFWFALPYAPNQG